MLTIPAKRWSECVVAATGPSLTPEVAETVRGRRVIAVNDAYRLLPFADVLYACDAAWWDVHAGCPGFAGEKWSCHGTDKHNNKRAAAEKYGLRLVQGHTREGFCLDGAVHYGSNSGFQAINLALLFGCTRILLVGFDMRVNGKRHFFGSHPEPLNNNVSYTTFVPFFERAAKTLPAGIEILNCTPNSALTCFPLVDIHDAIAAPAGH